MVGCHTHITVFRPGFSVLENRSSRRLDLTKFQSSKVDCEFSQDSHSSLAVLLLVFAISETSSPVGLKVFEAFKSTAQTVVFVKSLQILSWFDLYNLITPGAAHGAYATR